MEVDPSTTKYLVPWFVITKMEDNGKEKNRLIADCRQLNQFLDPQPFKLDHWQNIFPLLRKNMWAAKIDLKDAYFHLGLSTKIRPYVHMKIGEKTFQFNAACFGHSSTIMDGRNESFRKKDGGQKA